MIVDAGAQASLRLPPELAISSETFTLLEVEHTPDLSRSLDRLHLGI